MLDVDEKRKIRIMERARRYAEGYISLKDFFEDELKENDDIREQERQRMRKMFEEAKQESLKGERFSPDKKPSDFHITKKEYDKLSLLEQTKLYNEHPKEIRKLLGYWDDVELKEITKEEFQMMTLHEKSKYFNKCPEKFKALLEGTIDSVDLREEME